MIVTRDYANRIILHVMCILVFLRSTNMGFGYPSSEYNLASITYMPQKIMQAGVFGLLLFFIFINFRHVLARITVSAQSLSLFAVILLSITFSPDKLSTLRFLVSSVAIFLPLYLFYIFLGRDSLTKLVFKLLVAAIIINFAYCIVFPEYARMTANHDGSWRGMFVHKNVSGAFFATASVFLYSILPHTKGLHRQLTRFAFFGGVLLAMLSNSMTAILVLGIGFSTLAVLRYLGLTRDKSKRIIILASYLLVVILGVSFLSQYYEEILIALGRDPTLTGRTELWDVLLVASSERPLLGYGIGYFHRPEVMLMFSTEFGWEAKSTHSSFIDLLLGIGVIGLGIFLWVISSMLFKNLVAVENSGYSNRLLFGIGSCVVCILAIAATSSNVFLGNSIHWALLVTFLCLLNRQERL